MEDEGHNGAEEGDNNREEVADEGTDKAEHEGEDRADKAADDAEKVENCLVNRGTRDLNDSTESGEDDL